MKQGQKWGVLVLVPVLVLCACSAQKSLAQRLAGADRVVVTNTSEGLSISVTGADVSKIVQAIASGRKESPLVSAALGLTLEFYKGAAHLGTVNTSYTVFWVGNKPYSDTTGTLTALHERFRQEHPPRAP